MPKKKEFDQQKNSSTLRGYEELGVNEGLWNGEYRYRVIFLSMRKILRCYIFVLKLSTLQDLFAPLLLTSRGKTRGTEANREKVSHSFIPHWTFSYKFSCDFSSFIMLQLFRFIECCLFPVMNLHSFSSQKEVIVRKMFRSTEGICFLKNFSITWKAIPWLGEKNSDEDHPASTFHY